MSRNISPEEALAKVPDMVKARFSNAIDFLLIGNPDTIRKRIAAYEAAGVQELQIGFFDVIHQLDSIRRFAQEFIG